MGITTKCYTLQRLTDRRQEKTTPYIYAPWSARPDRWAGKKMQKKIKKCLDTLSIDVILISNVSGEISITTARQRGGPTRDRAMTKLDYYESQERAREILCDQIALDTTNQDIKRSVLSAIEDYKAELDEDLVPEALWDYAMETRVRMVAKHIMLCGMDSYLRYYDHPDCHRLEWDDMSV